MKRQISLDDCQNFLQCRYPQRKINPHRHNKQHQNNRFMPEFSARKDIGYWVREQQTHACRDNRNPKTVQKRSRGFGIFQKPEQVL